MRWILSEVLITGGTQCLATLPDIGGESTSSSSSTLSCISFPSFFAFQEDMWDTQISAVLSSPTVSLPFVRHYPTPGLHYIDYALPQVYNAFVIIVPCEG